MEFTLIYPNQLFSNHPSLSKSRKILLIEDPLFFGDEEFPARFHKQKLLLHYMSMEQYRNSLIGQGYNISIVKRESLSGKNYIETVLQKFNVTTLPDSVLFSYSDNSPDFNVTLSSGNQTCVPKALPVYV